MMTSLLLGAISVALFLGASYVGGGLLETFLQISAAIAAVLCYMTMVKATRKK